MSSTLDEAANNAASTLTDSSETSEASKKEEAKTEAPQDEKTESDQGESKKEGETETEWKFSDVDPNSLSPELQEVYHNLNRGYTQGMQKKSAEIKALKQQLEELQGKIPQDGGEKPIQQPRYINEQEKVDYSRMTPYEFAEYLREQSRQDVKIERENQYIEQAEKEFFTIDERLSEDSPNHDKFLLSALEPYLIGLRKEYEAQNGTIIGFDYKEHTKKFIQEYDSFLAAKQKNFVASKQQEARNQKNKFAKAQVRSANTHSSSRKMSLDDALSAAVEKMGL